MAMQREGFETLEITEENNLYVAKLSGAGYPQSKESICLYWLKKCVSIQKMIDFDLFNAAMNI